MESMYERKNVGYDTRSCEYSGIPDLHGYKHSHACSSHYLLAGRIRYINEKKQPPLFPKCTVAFL